MKKSRFSIPALILGIFLISLLPGCAGPGPSTGFPPEVACQPAAQQKAGGLSIKLKTGWNAITFNQPVAKKFSSVIMFYGGETKLLKDAVPAWTQSTIRYLKGRAWVLLQTNSATASFQPGGKYYIYSAYNGVIFDFNLPLPNIVSLSQAYGQPGTRVVISGSNFGATQGTSSVTFNGTAAAVTSWSATRIICTVPAGATTGNVLVTVCGQAGSGVKFTVVVLKWTYATGGAVFSSPAIGSNGTLYAGADDCNLYAVNSADGSLKWSYPMDYVYSSPAVGSDGTVYVGSDDCNLYAINPDGTLKWSYATGDCVESSPAIGSNGTIYVGSFDNNLYAINPDGTLKWSYATGDIIWSSPAVGSDETVYVGSPDTNVYAINPDGTLKWSYTTGAGVYGSPTLGPDGTIYIGSDDCNLYAINPDGTLKWSYATGDMVESAPAIGSDGTIYVGSCDRNLYALNPDGTLKWTYATGSWVYSSPAIGSDGTIYVGSEDKNIYAINPDGTLKWSYTTGNMVDSSPFIDSYGTICVGSNDGNIYAIEELYANMSYLSSISPDSGPTGTSVTITGTNFGADQGTSTIALNGMALPVTTWSDTRIVCIVPVGATTGNVVVVSGGRTSNAINFLVGPRIDNLNPTSGLWGASVTVTGIAFGADQGASTITFNGVMADVTSWSDTQILCTVPVVDYSGNVVVTVDGQAGRGVYFTITEPGTMKWSFTPGVQVFSSPAIGSDGTIYIGSCNNNMYALNPDGTEKWRASIGEQTDSSPAIGSDGTVYIGSANGMLYAFNLDGTFKWSHAAQVGRSSPAIGSDGTIYVGSWNNNLYAIYPDGTEKWSYATGGAVLSSPAIGSDGTVYVGSDDSNLYAINPDGSLKWSYPTGNYVRSSPSIGSDGTVYVGSDDNKLYAINPDGTLKWSYDAGNPVYTSPSIGADGTVYMGTHAWGGKLYAINPDGSLKWNYNINLCWSSPAVCSDGTVYAGSGDGKLYALNSDGTLRWCCNVVNNIIYSSPAIGPDGTIYVGAYDGKLYAINGSGTLADTAWPMFHGNLRHTGCINVPQISQVSSSSGMPGASITITGSHFGVSKGTVTIHGVNADPAGVTWTDTQITCIVPGAPDGGGSLYVTRPDGRISNSVSFDIPQ